MGKFLFLQTRITLCRASSSRLNHIDSPHLVHFDNPDPFLEIHHLLAS